MGGGFSVSGAWPLGARHRSHDAFSLGRAATHVIAWGGWRRKTPANGCMSIGGYTFLFDVDEAPKKNVFFDPTKRRQSRVKTLLRTGLAAVLVWCAFFFSGTVPLAGIAEELVVSLAHQGHLGERRHGRRPRPWSRTTTRIMTHDLQADLRPTLADHHRVSAAAACAPKPAPVMAALADAGQLRRVYGHIPTALRKRAAVAAEKLRHARRADARLDHAVAVR